MLWCILAIGLWPQLAQPLAWRDAAKPASQAEVYATIRKGIDSHTPVVVWLNWRYDLVEYLLDDCLHVHASEWRGERGPGAIVMRPQDGVYLYWEDVLPVIRCVPKEIRARYHAPRRALVPAPAARGMRC